MVLPNMPQAAARSRAEAWRRAVAARSVGHGNPLIGFINLLGLAAYPEHGKAPDELTRCAEPALCRTRAAGRKRVLAEAG